MLNPIVRRLLAVFQTITGVLFLVLFALNILRIALRYFIGASWLWVPDFSRLLFVWIVFIGAAVLLGRNEHLLMDFFLDRAGPVLRRRLGLFIHAVQGLFCAVLVVMGVQIAQVRMGIPFDTWDFPTGWAYLAVPVCGFFMVLFSLNIIIETYNSKETSE
jgi:TRAP-type C4-dicarboxylate transport system permease small subunit